MPKQISYENILILLIGQYELNKIWNVWSIIFNCFKRFPKILILWIFLKQKNSSESSGLYDKLKGLKKL